jgi:hypothetical protein
MIIVIIIADSVVDVSSSSLSRIAIIVALELVLECCVQLRQSLLLLLELPFKLSKLL